MTEINKKRVTVFTEQEKKNIVNDFEYYNIKKEREHDPENGENIPTDPFAE